MPTRITSRQNGRIKAIIRLNERRYRDEQQLTLVEGIREVTRAIQQGIVPQEVYLCPELLPETALPIVAHLRALADNGRTQLFEVTPAVYEKMAYRGDSGGVIIVIPYLSLSLGQLTTSALSLFAIIEGAEKPGNLGAILRTADAAGVDAVLLSSNGSGTDIHNPNVIRASLGTLFAVPVAVADNTQLISWLHAHNICMVATTPTATKLYTAVDMTQPIAIIAGSESDGLSREWLEHAGEKVRIPMNGIADSLNLSTSMAVMLYEAVRQRSLQ